MFQAEFQAAIRSTRVKRCTNESSKVPDEQNGYGNMIFYLLLLLPSAYCNCPLLLPIVVAYCHCLLQLPIATAHCFSFVFHRSRLQVLGCLHAHVLKHLYKIAQVPNSHTTLSRSSTLGTSSSSRTIAVDSKAHGNKWAVRALRVARLSPQAFCRVSPSPRASLRCRALAKTILVLWSAFRLMQCAVSAWASSWRVYMCTSGAACS